MLSVVYADCHTKAHYAEYSYAECRYAECRYAECRGAHHRHRNTKIHLQIIINAHVYRDPQISVTPYVC